MKGKICLCRENCECLVVVIAVPVYLLGYVIKEVGKCG